MKPCRRTIKETWNRKTTEQFQFFFFVLLPLLFQFFDFNPSFFLSISAFYNSIGISLLLHEKYRCSPFWTNEIGIIELFLFVHSYLNPFRFWIWLFPKWCPPQIIKILKVLISFQLIMHNVHELFSTVLLASPKLSKFFFSLGKIFTIFKFSQTATKNDSFLGSQREKIAWFSL